MIRDLPLSERRYWKIRRDLERIEAVGAFVASYVTSGAASVVWLFIGWTCVLGLWTWIERRWGA